MEIFDKIRAKIASAEPGAAVYLTFLTDTPHGPFVHLWTACDAVFHDKLGVVEYHREVCDSCEVQYVPATAMTGLKVHIIKGPVGPYLMRNAPEWWAVLSSEEREDLLANDGVV